MKGEVLFNEPMFRHTTFRIGGPADILVIPEDLEDIEHVLNYAKEKKITVTVIGNGSKILVSDGGIRGIVIKMAGTLDHVRFDGKHVNAGSGLMLPKLLTLTLERGLSGLEFSAGIPGTVGGATVMNAGTHIGSMSDIIEAVTIMDMPNCSIRVLSKYHCGFGYRKSVFQKKKIIVLGVLLQLKKNSPENIKEKVNMLIRKRLNTQPLSLPSAGSVFKNPPGFYAGKLIEDAGLKGFRIGDAQISTVHANFIVNLGKAIAKDVVKLIKIIQRRVKEKYGITLIPEILFIGEPPLNLEAGQPNSTPNKL